MQESVHSKMFLIGLAVIFLCYVMQRFKNSRFISAISVAVYPRKLFGITQASQVYNQNTAWNVLYCKSGIKSSAVK